MSRGPRFSVKQIAEALRQSGGIQAAAAALLEQSYLRPCSRQLINNQVAAHPELRQICDEQLEEFLDLAEGKLRAGVMEGEPSLIKYALSTLGKNRGFTTKVEHAGSGPNGEIPIIISGDDSRL